MTQNAEGEICLNNTYQTYIGVVTQVKNCAVLNFHNFQKVLKAQKYSFMVVKP